MSDPSYVAGLLSEVLGWEWVLIADQPGAHLMNPIMKRKRITACGIRNPERFTPASASELIGFCEICIERNGGQP